MSSCGLLRACLSDSNSKDRFGNYIAQRVIECCQGTEALPWCQAKLLKGLGPWVFEAILRLI